jgi:aspartate 1-decarboxylase
MPARGLFSGARIELARRRAPKRLRGNPLTLTAAQIPQPAGRLEGIAMFLTMMKGKLHRAAVTQCDLHYEGSCSIDIDLLEAANILPHEKIDIWNITNGARISTYAIEAPRGSKTIGINGAAARYFQVADRVIIAAFAQMDEQAARQHAPNVVKLNDRNEVVTGIA